MTGKTSGPSVTRVTADGRRLTPRGGGGAGISPNPTVRSAEIHRILQNVRRAERIRVMRAWFFLLLAVGLGIVGAHVLSWLLA